AASVGSKVSLVVDGLGADWATPIHDAAKASLAAAGVELAGGMIEGAGPNAPREDVFRIAKELRLQDGDAVVVIGGGSGIDAVKAAVAIIALGDSHELDSLFGVGLVSEKLAAEGKTLMPIVAGQLAASSGAHLTKYSNITDIANNQKLLIVDEAVIPPKAIFDYRWTVSMPRGLTMDGALDGIAHCLEVLEGASEEQYEKAGPICLLGIEMVVNNAKAAVEDPANIEARLGLGLGTDLGGYAIMIGGTNGAHLNSFSLVDLLPHGKACALMNPYYVVFFAPAIADRLRQVGEIYRAAGYITTDLASLDGRDLGMAVAQGMINLSADIGFPTTLSDVEGFGDEHIARCLAAAKNPKLEMKLKNMPVPLSADTVDEYMGPILQAAKTGDLNLIKTFQ
ncbi:MAG TPA: iron-containing alcohol dehydrogenase, partial [Phycisphaerae bacterium]|nr:iron-containing alcohol dehydrogenase [Phycisphaerae bacterium]